MKRGSPGRISNDAIVLIALFALVAVGGYLLARPGLHRASDISTSYNPDPKGVKAFYTLLGERLGYRVGRLDKPYTDLPKSVRVLFVVQPGALPAITEDERDALERWVSRGGTLFFLSDKFTGVTSAFSLSGPKGKGFIHAYHSRDTITNDGMRDYRNAVALLEALSKRARRGDLILFDEYHHGLAEAGDVAFGRQAIIAIWILVAAALLLCYSAGRRFGAVRALPKSETMRPGVELVNSLARLYKNARATDLAVGVLGEMVEQTVAQRPELATPRVQAVLEKCRAARAGQKLTDSELVNVARELHAIERELGIAS